mmetsp:Transcript_43853/g.80099  ORF Transcript_43853/g.80099 Transcript_43853/m.80099 type:complete len:143 (+) Transcript_43853:710-1138(+)
MGPSLAALHDSTGDGHLLAPMADLSMHCACDPFKPREHGVAFRGDPPPRFLGGGAPEFICQAPLAAACPDEFALNAAVEGELDSLANLGCIPRGGWQPVCMCEGEVAELLPPLPPSSRLTRYVGDAFNEERRCDSIQGLNGT